MTIYVAGAPTKPETGGWYGAKYASRIVRVFERDGRIFFPPDRLSGRPDDMFSEVIGKISDSDAGITFVKAKSSGPLIEAGMLAAMNKPQVIIASKSVLRSRILRGLPNLIGFARFGDEPEVEELLQRLRERIGRL